MLLSESVSTSLILGFDLVSLFFIVIPGVTTWPNKVRYTVCVFSYSSRISGTRKTELKIKSL